MPADHQCLPLAAVDATGQWGGAGSPACQTSASDPVLLPYCPQRSFQWHHSYRSCHNQTQWPRRGFSVMATAGDTLHHFCHMDVIHIYDKSSKNTATIKYVTINTLSALIYLSWVVFLFSATAKWGNLALQLMAKSQHEKGGSAQKNTCLRCRKVWHMLQHFSVMHFTSWGGDVLVEGSSRCLWNWFVCPLPAFVPVGFQS